MLLTWPLFYYTYERYQPTSKSQAIIYLVRTVLKTKMAYLIRIQMLKMFLYVQGDEQNDANDESPGFVVQNVKRVTEIQLLF